MAAPDTASAFTSVLATLDWSSHLARHRDSLVVPVSALQADSLLAAEAPRLASESSTLDASHWLRPSGEPPAHVSADRFRLRVVPVAGRHYPRLAFGGLASGPRDTRPVRLLGMDADGLLLDLNHPLAGRTVRLELARCEAAAAPGRLSELFEGPGMQVPPATAEAVGCYLPVGACARQDEGGDAGFYARPRLVHHLDAACRRRVAALYAEFLRPGMHVLDLMSSWTSHLPDTLPPGLRLAGLGMNADELVANPLLAERHVHDLNQRPVLPFEDAAFDLVLCTASLEYLVQPQAVAAEVARVLRPGGHWVVSFSDRWFPSKAIRVWSELHPFERLGMAVWMLAGAGFGDLHTLTLRGIRRPADDPHAGERDSSDPLFALWGRMG